MSADAESKITDFVDSKAFLQTPQNLTFEPNQRVVDRRLENLHKQHFAPQFHGSGLTGHKITHDFAPCGSDQFIIEPFFEPELVHRGLQDGTDSFGELVEIFGLVPPSPFGEDVVLQWTDTASTAFTPFRGSSLTFHGFPPT